MQLFWRVLFVPFGFAMLLLLLIYKWSVFIFFGLSLLSLLTFDYLLEISISVNALRLHLSGLMDDNL
jgi:uncharacterized membrane protein